MTFRNKSKWAFYCRTTTLALGMAATQRVEGLFSVAKRMGVINQLSLCALWDVLRRVDTSLAIESARRVSWSYHSRISEEFPLLLRIVCFPLPITSLKVRGVIFVGFGSSLLSLGSMDQLCRSSVV